MGRLKGPRPVEGKARTRKPLTIVNELLRCRLCRRDRDLHATRLLAELRRSLRDTRGAK